jgi:hypothetical protein
MLTWHIMLGMVFTIIAHCHIINHPNTKYQTITACPPQQLLNLTPPKDSIKVYCFPPTPFAKSTPHADTQQHSYSWIPTELNTFSHKPDVLPFTPHTLTARPPYFTMNVNNQHGTCGQLNKKKNNSTADKVMNQVAQERRLREDKNKQQVAEKKVDEERLKAKKAKAANTKDILAIATIFLPADTANHKGTSNPLLEKDLTSELKGQFHLALLAHCNDVLLGHCFQVNFA